MPADERQTTEILLDLLRGAAAAHHIHETTVLGGKYDKEWPQWYAEHMAKALAEAGYQLVPTDAR